MKIGLIDYFLDEYHANNYPAWISAASGGDIQTKYAYAKIDSPKGGATTEKWCEANGIERLCTIEEVIEKSDGIIVLSPDNPEQHEELCRLPMLSGKPVYVDKTFARTRGEAERIFGWAESGGTPCYSSSALRFVPEYRELLGRGIDGILTRGPGTLENYSIHQIEPIISLMGPNVCRVMYIGTSKLPAFIMGFEDGRRAFVTHHGTGCPFGMAVDFSDGSGRAFSVESDLYGGFIAELVDFFRTGKIKVPHAETIAVMAVRETAIKASATPDQWLNL